ncbi:anaphase-promoting complex subunit 11 RING-H2 finger-domain-containing protein [Phyllosticta capitalensis]
MKVTIKQWNAVAAWRWDMPQDDMCGICRNPYDSTCAKCKFPGDGCPLLMGQCNHSFHMHCIEDWLKQEASQEKCPMCRQRMYASLNLEQKLTAIAFAVKDANASMTEA